MKPSCDWISAVDSIQKFAVVKLLVRRKNPQDVEGLTLYLGRIITLYLGLCRYPILHNILFSLSQCCCFRNLQCMHRTYW